MFDFLRDLFGSREFDHIPPPPDSIPCVGAVTAESRFPHTLLSKPLAVGMLDNTECTFEFPWYFQEPAPEEIDTAVENFLSADKSVLMQSQDYIWNYYSDCYRDCITRDDQPLLLQSRDQVWDHIQFGNRIKVRRKGDAIYLSMECECDWNIDDGLQIVFKRGEVISRISAYDGHMTNASSWNDPSLQGVVYVTPPYRIE